MRQAVDRRAAGDDGGRRPRGLVDLGVVAAREGRILFAGPAAEAPRFEPAETVPCDGRWITPGLVDCHTHLVHAGNRAHEFELRLKGASYEEIARAGGGIVSTMKATRAASEANLVASALPRLDRADEGGRHHRRNQVGLWPDHRRRDQDAARSAAALAR